MERLSLDNKLLKPMKEKLEKSIKDDKDFNEYLEPNYDYQITEKIKEAKGTYKSCLGFNYSVEIDGDDVLVKNVNEQQSLFGEE